MFTMTARLNARTILLVIAAAMGMLANVAEAGKWDKHHKGHSWMEPCSDGWWARIRDDKQANDDNRQVLRCLLKNCGWEGALCLDRCGRLD